jgi:hypothetical protein
MIEYCRQLTIDPVALNQANIIDELSKTLYSISASRESNQDDLVLVVDVQRAEISIGFSNFS